MKTKEEIEIEFQGLLKVQDSEGVWDFLGYQSIEITQEENIYTVTSIII